MSDRCGTLAGVTPWADVARDAPDFAEHVRRLFDARKHTTMATLRADGDGFRADIAEVALTKVGTPADHLVIESWHPGRGYERRARG